VSLSLNGSVADRLDEVAALLSEQGANEFRVRAYRRAATTLRGLPAPVTAILDTEGLAGLERLPGIGEGLARAIRDIVRLGYFPMLERLRGESDPVQLFESVPGLGRRLAARLHDELGLETLEDLEAAAHDGRLENIAGFGPKRLEGIRGVLAHRLARRHAAPPASPCAPPVAELLDVDREYREAAALNRLPLIAPRRFNPARRQWLPILHTSRGDRSYTVLFSNTARAHRLQKTGDWVVIYCDGGTGFGQWTVVTAATGPLAGQRVVRGREDEDAGDAGKRETPA
jgi:DNA polymerase (family X)